MKKTVEHVDNNPSELQPVLKEFREMVNNDSRLYMLFDEMFDQVSRTVILVDDMQQD